MRRSFGRELLLVVVTLGLYMPYWLWARNDELRKRFGDGSLARNEVWLGAGIVLASFGRAVFGGSNEQIAAFVSIGGLAMFAYGAYLLAENAESVAILLGIEPRLAPWTFGVGIGGAFALVEAGNVFETWMVRGLALAALAALPYLFFLVHETLEDVREELAARVEPATAAPPPA